MKKLLICLLLFCCSTAAYANNPLLTPQKEAPKHVAKQVQYPKGIQQFIYKIFDIQNDMKSQLSSLIRDIRDGGSKKSLLIILVLSFGYGMVHALGPGHGKTIACSYFLSTESRYRKGALLGNAVSFLHTLSAVIVVVVVYIILKQSFLNTFDTIDYWVRLISYGIIVFIGLFLLGRSVRHVWTDKRSTATHNHHAQERSIIPVSLAIGMVPCPGTTIVLLFAMSQGVLLLGILSVSAMALGMALTITMVSVITILARNMVASLLSQYQHRVALIHSTLEITGAFLVVLVGGSLLYTLF
ncbi:MAG: hypothetical protein DKM50_08850 [Candidatus Margulisiibacteriota bacterium]|nr:MAG: hypothetical protein A2X43_04430 [Candidatus Margulisbacteria bacterium GWD2_39_127]OGI04136.1 MAG: hypothetical protein A2X42_04735 [Candidatus Margulisbacteria bacterium GWF2_38_17]OGI05987.1 MAG: hypothetical protein A2X41_12245 [Candidatus Margulisbacteria bacterium GWE2_39_32]PZM79557.1 MAG: hypothetical protein DKM50_08850 [Candidatus Margulisiibacteriota bacterium]HAR63391.1 hypothetical protein [Candidatus Margulisiibacteriota bacterium]